MNLESTTDQLFTPLLIAAFNGKLELTKCLVAAGACIEARNKQHYTALGIAAQQGHASILGFLLDRYCRRSPNPSPRLTWFFADDYFENREGGCTSTEKVRL